MKEPKKLFLDQLKIISDIISTWIGLIAIIAGGLFAVFQYLEKEKSDRVKYTLDFFQSYNDKSVLSAREKFLVAWEDQSQKVTSLQNDKNVTNDQIREFNANVIEQNHIAGSSIVIIDFYESLYVCVKTKVCDHATVNALFLKDARRFYVYVAPFIEKRRAADDSFGRELEAFVAR